MKFKVTKPNIAEASADAIVLPANERLQESPGVSEAVFKAAGKKKLQKTCDEIGYCAVGNAVPTLAYGLNAKYIIHAVVPKWIDGNHKEYELLGAAYLCALQTADLMGCESVAFPLLASEYDGFDQKLAIAAAEKTISDFFGKNLKKAALIIRASQTENLVRTTGYMILTYSKENGVNKKTIDRREQTAFMIGSTKKLISLMAKDQAKKVLSWFRAKENRAAIIQCGIRTAAVFCRKKKQKR
ncbi:MAG: macro domain-containing protein [Clostridia bacterium]|nr:macro domain-containing protein [Clostridia bacterium]